MNSADLRKIVRRIELRTRRALGGPLAGLADAVHRGRGLDFEEVRLYQPGDDVRDIDWKASARSSRTYLKRYRDERQINVWLLVDVSAGFLRFAEVDGEFNPGLELDARSKRRFVMELTTLLGLSAALRLDRVGLCLFGAGERVFPPAVGERSVFRCICELANVVLSAPRSSPVDSKIISLTRAVESLAASSRGSSLILAISGFEDASAPDVLAKLSRRNEVRAMRVLHPWEVSLPNVGLVRWRDGASGRVCTLDASCPRTRAFYEAQARQASSRIREQLASRRIELLTMTTDRPAGEWLLRYARR